MDRIRVGIVGLGRIADLHVPGYFNRSDAVIAAICDTDRDLLKSRGAQWSVDKLYGDFDDLLADEKIDMVEILTPHHLHCDMVCRAAGARKHISVQKPMAFLTDECDEMIRTCFHAGVQLRVFENFVFYPPFVLAKKLIEEGEIGEVSTIRLKLGALSGGWHVPLSAWIWRMNKKLCGPGPTVFDDGYHKFSMAVDLFGPIKEVKAWVDYSLGSIDSPAMVAFTYENSPVLGYFETSFTPGARMRSKYYGADERIEICGSRGVIEINRFTGKLFDNPPLVLHTGGQTRCFDDLRDDWLDSFVDSTHHFIDALTNFRAPKLSGETGRHVMQAALAAFVSSNEDRRVRPDDVTGRELE